MMKDNQVDKKSKNDTLLTARVGTERKAKFIAMCEEAKKSQSTALRELIDNGKVEIIPNGEELIKDVAEMRKKVNQYSLKMSDDIQAIKKDIQEINSCIQSYGSESELVKMYLAKASLRLNDFQQQYNEKITICTRVFPARSGNHGNF